MAYSRFPKTDGFATAQREYENKEDPRLAGFYDESQEHDVQLPGPPPTFTVAEIEAAYDQVMGQWGAWPGVHKLVEELEKRAAQTEKW
jgi:hypothetical protein